jgi:hypothetical protein
MKTIKGALNGKHLCASIFGGSADISKTFVMNQSCLLQRKPKQTKQNIGHIPQLINRSKQ